MAVNLYGNLHMHHAVLKGMVERGAGRIVSVASDAARFGSSGENVVCPGLTDTALFRDFAGEGERGEKLRGALQRSIPFGRLGQPEDLSGIIVFLASDEATSITGQVISVSGGLTMAG